jgi:hypothetical protein
MTHFGKAICNQTASVKNTLKTGNCPTNEGGFADDIDILLYTASVNVSIVIPAPSYLLACQGGISRSSFLFPTGAIEAADI